MRSSEPYNLLCIEYPGIVNNVDKALETLGGLKAVAKSTADPKKRLELRFRPNDVYCKSADSSNDKACGLLMKVLRRKKRHETVDTSGEGLDEGASLLKVPSADGITRESPAAGDGYEYQVEVLGKMTNFISFPGMCDYQFLPVARNKDGQNEGILHKLELTLKTKRDEYLARDAPLFLPPQIFSRFEFPLYGFMNEKPTDEKALSDMPKGLLGTGRKARPAYIYVLGFMDPTPAEPMPESLEIAERYSNSGLKEELTALFKERAIWSSAALRYRLRHNQFIRVHGNLYKVLACIAYSFSSGPWRSFYVRFGYDPRQDPSSKKYQCIDFRSRQLCSLENDIKCRRRTTQTNQQRKRLNLAHLRDGDGDVESNEPKLTDFEFHPDILPPQRQIFYHVCDIYDPEVHDLLTKNDGKEPEVCDERNGWGIPHFTDLCRAVMTKHVHGSFPASAAVPKHDKKKKRRITKLIEGANQLPTDVNKAEELCDLQPEDRMKT